MNAFIPFLITAILSAVVGGVVSYLFLKGRSSTLQEAALSSAADKETRLTTLQAEMAQSRTAADSERSVLNSKIDQLQLDLRGAVEARAKLDGAGESLVVFKAQIETKDQEIALNAERITALSSDLAHFRTAASEANKAKDEALKSKDAEASKLITEKENSLSAQLAEIKKACDKQLADKDLASLNQLTDLKEHCQNQLDEKDRHIDEQRRMLAEAEKKLTETFDSLSVKALTTVSEQFMKTAKATLEAAQTEAKGDLKLKQQAIEELLKPVAESLDKLEKHQVEMEQRRVSAFDSIEKGIKTLSQEADSLANALRKPGTRGAWGEMNLKVILDNAGLEEGQHYRLQHSTEDDEDGRLRTDVIIQLPNGREFIIDSKTPLESYWDGMNAPDEAARLIKFAAHGRLVRDHIKKLSSKSYWTRYKASPDCVVMFIPTEGAYQAAIEADRTMLTDAHKNRVYIANPMTLVSMIHIAAYVLKEERSRQNATDIQESATELYKRVSKFVGDFSDLGRNLRLSVQSYNTAVGSLDGRVLPKARDISRLGAGSGNEIKEVVVLETFPRELTSQEYKELPKTSEAENILTT
jgi:DNA recombination protein RmuC